MAAALLDTWLATSNADPAAQPGRKAHQLVAGRAFGAPVDYRRWPAVSSRMRLDRLDDVRLAVKGELRPRGGGRCAQIEGFSHGF